MSPHAIEDKMRRAALLQPAAQLPHGSGQDADHTGDGCLSDGRKRQHRRSQGKRPQGRHAQRCGTGRCLRALLLKNQESEADG